MLKPILSVIIPLRCTDERPYFFDRAIRFLETAPQQEDVEFMIVDSGSDSKYRKRVRAACAVKNTSYHYLESQGKEFSIGEARDCGVMHSRGAYVTFLDVDLAIPVDFYGRIISEINARKMVENPADFFLVPCIYLREKGNAHFTALSETNRFSEIQRQCMEGDRTYIEFFAPSSSVMVVNRNHYLMHGGHRPEFRAHGGEDFELIHRLAAHHGRYVRPENYYVDLKSYETEFEGFRALFSLYGYPQYSKGLFVVHLWHPRGKISPGSAERQSNDQLLYHFMQAFDATGDEPFSLPDLSGERKTLIFGRQATAALNVVRQAFQNWRFKWRR